MLHTMTMEYGTITGRLVAAVADTPDDPDVNPDIIPITGTVTFTPSVKAILVASEAITAVPAPITAVLDANGYVSLNGVQSVTVLATTSTYYNPNGWTYKVSFDNLAANGRRVTFDSYNIEVPVGATIDLSSVTPISSSTGTPIVRGPKGDKGDTGPQGNPGPSDAQVATYFTSPSSTRTAADARYQQLFILTGATDAQVQAWLNAAQPGPLYRLIGSMTTTAGFDIPDGVALEGYGATITAASSATQHVIRVGNRCSVRGLRIDASAVTANTVTAVQVSSKTEVTIRDVVVSGSKRCGIEVANSTRYTITNCTVRNTTAQAINIVMSDIGTITGNHIDTALHGIQFWGGDSATLTAIGIRNILIANNQVYNITGGIWGSLAQGIAITGNHVENCSDVGIDFEGCQSCTATGNTVRNAAIAGLSVFYGSTSCEFVGNTVINDTALGSGFKASSTKTSSLIRVIGNTFQVTQSGVVVTDSGALSDSSFADNTMVTTKSGQSGLVATNCSNIQVRGNRVTVTLASGIVNVGGLRWNIDDNDINTTSDTSTATDTVAGIRWIWTSGTNSARSQHVHGNRIWGFNKGILDDSAGDNTSQSWIKDNQVDTIRYRGTYGSGYYGIIENNRAYTDPNSASVSSTL